MLSPFPWLDCLHSKVTAAIFAALAVSVMAFGTASAVTNYGKRCGTTSVRGPNNGHLRAKVLVRHGNISCKDAAALARGYYDRVWAAPPQNRPDGGNAHGGYYKVRGWTCNFGLAQSQGFCRSHNKRVDASTRHDDGWTF